MVSQVPVQIWLLIAIAAAAYAPARFVYKYTADPSFRRDLTRPADGLGSQISNPLARNLSIVAALVVLTGFIFTPAAAQFARSPTFWPILTATCGAWALFSVTKGLAIGQIQPFARGFYNTYARQLQPKRFWASMGWNAIFGLTCVWLAFKMIGQAPVQALEDRCYDTKNSYSPQAELSACNQLISGRGRARDDLASIIAARGSAYYRLSDYRHALADYSNAIRLDPSDSSTHYNRGLVDEQLGDPRSAIIDYGDAVRTKADNADAYLNRGLIFLDNGSFDQAVTDFTQAHELDPKDAVPLANRGMSYAWKRDRVRAEQDFRAVRSTDPSNVVLLRGEALLSMNAGDMQNGVDHLTSALNRDPNDTWSLAMRAEAYRRLGESDKAEADANQLQRLSENTDKSRFTRK